MGDRLFGMALIASVMVLASAAGAAAQDTAGAVTVDEFVVDNSIYTLYHEFGHLLVGEFGIPILGREEDAADNIATVILLNYQTEEADNALLDSADGWFLSDEFNTPETLEDADFYDTHSLDLQRAYQIVCLMVGADPGFFGEVADNAGLDPDRQAECADEFNQKVTSVEAVTTPLQGLPAKGASVSVVYEDTSTYAADKSLLQSAKLLEILADSRGQFAIPRPITLRATECGEANAFYDPEAGEIVYCYELADNFRSLYLQAYPNN